MENKRLNYIDFAKVFAMLIVTIGHCAQSLSGSIFPELIITKDLFISIHMPIFMIASGFVLNIKKLRTEQFSHYFASKFKRLIIPLIIWYVIYCILAIKIPSIYNMFVTYWYLYALFMSLLTIKILTMFISNDNIVIITGVCVVLLLPFTDYAHLNYMFPFIIVGYYLKSIIKHLNIYICTTMLVVYAVLYYFWDINHTVYIAPFNILGFNSAMAVSFIFRLTIGVIGSIAFIGIFKYFDNSYIIKKISRFGKYSLVFYTMTTIINFVVNKVVVFFGLQINDIIILDIASIVLALLELWIIYLFAKKFEGNRKLSELLGF